MSNAHERRAPGTARMQFDAMVEVGGALGPSFEAQAVNLSEEGMSLRTAYLPEVGQPITCRFDAGQGMSVVAAGEVLWKDDMGDGGEFGIRFTNLDSPSTVALQRILGMAEDGGVLSKVDPPGRKVRLHIDGLGSPMRARIKDQVASGVTAYSELGFLRMGKPLELEDAVSGSRRPALIDRVEIEVNGESLVPQLVVSLRYDDTDGRAAVANEAHIAIDEALQPQADMMNINHHTSTSANSMMDQDRDPSHGGQPEGSGEHEAPAVEVKTTRDEAADGGDEDVESSKFKTAFSKKAAKITPALMSWAKRAKVAAALLAAKARGGGTGEDVEIPMRRTTAPAPGGGLHAAGRKVVRGSVSDAAITTDHFANEPPPSRFKITKKKAAIGASVGIALVLIFIALKKPAPAAQLANAPPGDATTAAGTAIPGGGGPNAGKGGPTPPPADPLAAAAAAMAKGPHGKAVPFTNGPVGAHPTIIKVKMDGNIDGIQGATQPTGFTIVTPNRKSMDPTNTLADKDPRIANLHVANEQPGGAEFSVTFKDGVPNYIVRSHGDTLELVLAAPNSHGEKSEAHAKKKKGKKH